jgi:1-propanol dehydrogenase
MQSLRPDVVMGFGGGSALDAAKAIVWFSRQFGIEIETCVAIPTTSGTGSEVTSACVISDPDKGIKYPLFNNALYPDMAILDPTLVVSVPPAITANTGMDVLTHALEAYVSTKASDFTDALAEKAAQIVFQYLPVAVSKGECLATRGKCTMRQRSREWHLVRLDWGSIMRLPISWAVSFICHTDLPMRCC